MAENSRMQRRQVAQKPINYKRPLAFIFWLMISLIMALGTFFNPAFLKGSITSSSNTTVVTQQMNSHFNRLATIVGGNSSDQNMLSDKQTRQIANLIIDYQYGFHIFRADDDELATQIKDVALTSEKTDTSQAKDIRKKLKQQKSSAIYIVSNAFDLATVTLVANLITVFRIVAILVLIICLIALFSILHESLSLYSVKRTIHEAMAGLMWASFWLMLISGFLSVIPLFMDTTIITIADIGYILELSSGIFLDFVIVGAVCYIASALPWELTSE